MSYGKGFDSKLTADEEELLRIMSVVHPEKPKDRLTDIVIRAKESGMIGMQKKTYLEIIEKFCTEDVPQLPDILEKRQEVYADLLKKYPFLKRNVVYEVNKALGPDIQIKRTPNGGYAFDRPAMQEASNKRKRRIETKDGYKMVSPGLVEKYDKNDRLINKEHTPLPGKDHVEEFPNSVNTKIDYLPDGSIIESTILKSGGFIKDSMNSQGEYHGEQIEQHPDGFKITSQYENGNITKRRFDHPSGGWKEKNYDSNGKLHGVQKDKSNTGSYIEENYKHGELHGRTLLIEKVHNPKHGDGQSRTEQNYNNGQLHGLSTTTYSYDGHERTEIAIYSKGEFDQDATNSYKFELFKVQAGDMFKRGFGLFDSLTVEERFKKQMDVVTQNMANSSPKVSTTVSHSPKM